LTSAIRYVLALTASQAFAAPVWLGGGHQVVFVNETAQHVATINV
jgi:hypothetical protein